MTDIVAAVEFGGFIVAGWSLVFLLGKVKSERRQRALITLLLVYVVVISFGNAVLRINLWPFSSWDLVTRTQSGGGWPDWRTFGVTADGKEYPVDYRAFEPLNAHELGTWMLQDFVGLTREQQGKVGEYFLRQMNRARQNVRKGKEPGYLGRFLGPLVAPAHMIYPPGWLNPDDVPADRFVAVRWYRSIWDLEAMYQDMSTMRLVPLYEYSKPQ